MHSVDLKGAIKNKAKQKTSQKQGYKDVEIPAGILH